MKIAAYDIASVCAVMANPHITVTLLTWKYPRFQVLPDPPALVSAPYRQ